MASHRMPDSDRPRRPVPAWVTAPVDDAASGPGAAAGLEARPGSAPSDPAPETPGHTAPTGSGTRGPAPVVAADDARPDALPHLDPSAVVPDYPPSEDDLPPAPTSPALHTVPVDRVEDVRAAPVSPIDAVREPVAAGPAHQGPTVPRTGQPRFSVPGLEHVVVEGVEPEPSGPVGYRTPARFAHQQATVLAPDVPSFETLLTAAPTRVTMSVAPTEQLPTVGPHQATTPDDADPALPSDAPATGRRTLGATPGAVLGAVAALLTLGLAARWFTAPSTVHVVGLALGAVALVCSFATLRNGAATWQRPVALLGAVLGVVGTLALLWAVAAAVLPGTGVTLPDVTGTGTVPRIAP